MKFFAAASLFSLAVADATIKAPSPVKRDIATISGVVTGIQDALGQLDTAVKGFNGAGQVGSLQSASTNVLDKINQGVKDVSATSPIEVNDALSLQPLVSNLQTATEGAVNDLIAKKDVLVSAGVGAVVEDQLNQQYKAAGDLSKAITSKVPSSVQEIAATLSKGITDAIQKGIDAFKDTGSAPSSSGGAAPTSGSSGSGSSTSASGSAPTSGSAGSTTSAGSASPTGGASGPRTNGTATSSPAPFTGSAAVNVISTGVVGALAMAAAAMML